MLPYFSLIQKYIDPASDLYRVYIIHVSNVTRLAIKIARKKGLSALQLQFVEEASMLHDIGIINTKTPEIFCFGEKPYIAHLTEGREILFKENLPLHARVAANHVGVGGLTKDEIVNQHLPLPPHDIVAETIEEKIISYADCFYSKNPKNLWRKKKYEEIVEKLAKRPGHQERFKQWYKEFGD
ncbi:MAG: HD domain-containing protein [Bacteroidia bacterium]